MLLRSNLPDFFLDAAIPFLEKTIEEEYEAYKPLADKLFNVSDMKNGIVQHTQLSSLGVVSQVGEAEEIPQDQIRAGYPTTYKAVKYGVILATSREVLDDSRVDVVAKNPRRLARAFASAQEISLASIFNNAFTTVGGDGKPLIAVDHPLLTPGAGTGSNRLAVDSDLSQTTLQDAQILFNKQVDSAGNKLMIKSRYLVVPPELEFLAYELVRSILSPGNSTNNVNSMGPDSNYRLEVVVDQYLTDNDAWFLMADPTDTELYWFWARRPEMSTEMEFKTEVALTKMTARWTVGWSDWRGIVGTPGAP